MSTKRQVLFKIPFCTIRDLLATKLISSFVTLIVKNALISTFFSINYSFLFFVILSVCSYFCNSFFICDAISCIYTFYAINFNTCIFVFFYNVVLWFIVNNASINTFFYTSCFSFFVILPVCNLNAICGIVFSFAMLFPVCLLSTL